jgi:excisionase family DNA binding protein
MRQLLTVPQIAAQLGVSLPRAYELCRLGLVPGVVRLGRQIRLDARAVDEWIARGGQALPEGGDVTSATRTARDGERFAPPGDPREWLVGGSTKAAHAPARPVICPCIREHDALRISGSGPRGK